MDPSGQLFSFSRNFSSFMAKIYEGFFGLNFRILSENLSFFREILLDFFSRRVFFGLIIYGNVEKKSLNCIFPVLFEFSID